MIIKKQTVMEKLELVQRITDILRNYGWFSIGELDGETGVNVGELGNYVGLAEKFFIMYATINVYNPRSFSSDEVDSYEMVYEEMNEDALSDILLLCEQWEAECIKTQKRISN
jgi:hypothetical protein